MQHDVAEITAYVFIDLAVIMVIARLMGRLAIRVGQPAVVGEIIAGILLGPTLLGALPGDLDTKLFPPDVRPFLNVLAQLGLVLFMFLVGLEVDLSFIRGRERIAVSVSVSSIVLPFSLGVLLATFLHASHDVFTDEDGTSAIKFSGFALFLGVAMSITAFPVLARILSERGMHRIPTGVLALACAAVDDVLAWALLAVVIAVVAAGSVSGVFAILLYSVVFALVMFLVVKPLLELLVTRYERLGRLTPEMLAMVLIGILASAWVTEEIGIHFIFGAFVFGVVMPRKGAAARLNHEVIDRLEQVSVLLLLPVFFVVTGLGVDVSAIDLTGLGELALILLVAISGKFIGAFAAARAQRVPRRQATALGVLMNTRGLTELVILNLGRDNRVLDDQMFTLMVIMAVVTTVMTSPLLKVVYPPRVLERDIAAAERAAMGLEDAYTVVVLVEDPQKDAGLVDLACDLVGRESPAQVVVARVVKRSRPKPEVASGLGADLMLMATTADELRQLARVVEARGLKASVASRFSDDPWAEVADLATSSAADVVVVRSGWGVPEGSTDATPWPAQLNGTVVVVGGELGEPGLSPRGPVSVVQDGDANGRAALRLAAQASMARAVALQLQAGDGRRAERRAAGVGESLRRAGVLVAADDEPDALPSLLVAPAGVSVPASDDLTPLLVVHAGTADTDRDMDETLAGISTGDAGA